MQKSQSFQSKVGRVKKNHIIRGSTEKRVSILSKQGRSCKVGEALLGVNPDDVQSQSFQSKVSRVKKKINKQINGVKK